MSIHDHWAGNANTPNENVLYSLDDTRGPICAIQSTYTQLESYLYQIQNTIMLDPTWAIASPVIKNRYMRIYLSFKRANTVLGPVNTGLGADNTATLNDIEGAVNPLLRYADEAIYTVYIYPLRGEQVLPALPGGVSVNNY